MNKIKLAHSQISIRSGKHCMRLDLLAREDILLCFSGGTDLVSFGLSGCTWLTIQDSRHFSLSLQISVLNGSYRGFSNFCDRLAVQRRLAERLLREVVQHWSF